MQNYLAWVENSIEKPSIHLPLIDEMLTDHNSLKELDNVHALTNWLRIESLLTEQISKYKP
jgi:hypothetical protein